ncbi:hypothetical protein Tco_0985971 [Tanacetum coccineum]
MSRMDEDLFTYEVEIHRLASITCDLNEEDDLEQEMTHGSDVDMEYDPSNTRGDDEVELTDEESFDSDDGDDEVAKIFRIDTNVFDFKTPMCKTFKEFNYLLQIDPDVLSNDIDGFKTYYGYTKNHGQTMEYGKNPLLLNIIVNHSHLKVDIQNGQLVAGKMTDIVMVGEDGTAMRIPSMIMKKENEKEHRNEERCELFDNPHQETPVCKIRFEMIKYSFGQDEEYVAIKECKYDDLTNTNEDVCWAYQEIFCSMDEGWMDLAGKEIDNVGEVSIIWNPMCVVVMLQSRRIYNTHSFS